jgi:hypothetical protein
LERAAGIEPATYSLGSCRSTTELRPRKPDESDYLNIAVQFDVPFGRDWDEIKEAAGDFSITTLKGQAEPPLAPVMTQQSNVAVKLPPFAQ